MKYKLISLILTCFVIVLPIWKGKTQIKDNHVHGYYVTSENGDFTISDFTKVQLGMSYDEVVALMGEPTGSSGFGIVWSVYGLSDGSYVKLLFMGEEETLIKIIIVDPMDREFELK